MTSQENLDSAALDSAELKLKLGLINRREFIKRATLAGLSSMAAISISASAASAASNQIERRNNLLAKYDYIIIGAGAAGSVIANRLSADPSIKVLLLEAGSDQYNRPSIDVPLLWASNLGTEIDYARPSTIQPGLNDRQIFINGGKVLGGSSSINAMIWLRGDRRDYLEWQALAGRLWGPKRMFSMYERLLVTGQKVAENQPLTAAFLDSAQQTLGLPLNDANSNTQSITGASIAEANIINGRRFSALNGYLLPALERPNLTVLINTQVETLLMKGRRIRGVNCVLNGAQKQFRASETILCAGAIESPALLMRSGIGPKRVLREAGVELKIHHPGVGRRLQDHPLLIPINFMAQNLLPPVAGQGICTVNYIETRGPKHPPTVQVLGAHFPFGTDQPFETTYASLISAAKPLSRGYMRISGPSSSDPLIINPKYFSHPADMEDMIVALDSARALGSGMGMEEFFLQEVIPGPSVKYKEEKMQFIRQAAGTYFHYMGTCAMGHHRRAVVNKHLKVYGVKGLRIADASIMPTMPSVNTHVPTLMLAENAAEIILKKR